MTRHAYLASFTDRAIARAHFGQQYDIAACEPVTYTTGTGAVRVTAHTVTTSTGRQFVVRVGETLPTEALDRLDRLDPPLPTTKAPRSHSGGSFLHSHGLCPLLRPTPH